jgi:hydroxymethylpyrimidine pyrophosphatase-like HAD family hydrolase
LVALDVDGTLLRTDGSLSAPTLEALAADAPGKPVGESAQS